MTDRSTVGRFGSGREVRRIEDAGLHALLFDRWSTTAAWRDFTRGLIRWPERG